MLELSIEVKSFCALLETGSMIGLVEEEHYRRHVSQEN